MATRENLVSAAAEKLQILEAGQTLEDEDEEKIDAKVPGLFAQLSRDEICAIGDEDDIPDEWFDPLAGLLANMAASTFGKPYSPDVKRIFEMDLRRMNVSRATFQPMRAEHY